MIWRCKVPSLRKANVAAGAHRGRESGISTESAIYAEVEVEPVDSFNVCTMPAVADFIERLSASSNFLSCTCPDSFENTWPTARVVPLETGRCDPMAEYNRSYGYRVSNTTCEPMTIWVTKARGEPGRWWTINACEEIRFNVFGSALLFATTAEAYRVCRPNFMTKTVNTYPSHRGDSLRRGRETKLDSPSLSPPPPGHAEARVAGRIPAIVTAAVVASGLLGPPKVHLASPTVITNIAS